MPAAAQVLLITSLMLPDEYCATVFHLSSSIRDSTYSLWMLCFILTELVSAVTLRYVCVSQDACACDNASYITTLPIISLQQQLMSLSGIYSQESVQSARLSEP
jgi:hypothetical protein